MSKIVRLGDHREAKQAAAFENHAKASFLGFIGKGIEDAASVRPLSNATLARMDSLCEDIEANQREQHLLEG